MTEGEDKRSLVVGTEYVDVLAPPTFEPTGAVKPIFEAVKAGDWLGVMNIWLVRSNGSLLYQQRPEGGWEPGKLDGSVGGFYQAGESGLDGLREAREELGWSCPPEEISLLGRHLNVGVDSLGRERRLVVTVYMTVCDAPLTEFVLDKREVPALYEIAAGDVIESFRTPGWQFTARGIDHAGQPLERKASAEDLSYIFGGYHLKIAQIAQRYARGERQFYY
jgi:8-oxo-dGTP pyrophosphatase MutT (NUDIX family)